MEKGQKGEGSLRAKSKKSKIQNRDFETRGGGSPNLPKCKCRERVKTDFFSIFGSGIINWKSPEVQFRAFLFLFLPIDQDIATFKVSRIKKNKLGLSCAKLS